MSPGVPSLLQGSWAVRQDMMGGGEIVWSHAAAERAFQIHSHPPSFQIEWGWKGVWASRRNENWPAGGPAWIRFHTLFLASSLVNLFSELWDCLIITEFRQSRYSYTDDVVAISSPFWWHLIQDGVYLWQGKNGRMEVRVSNPSLYSPWTGEQSTLYICFSNSSKNFSQPLCCGE